MYISFYLILFLVLQIVVVFLFFHHGLQILPKFYAETKFTSFPSFRLANTSKYHYFTAFLGTGTPCFLPGIDWDLSGMVDYNMESYDRRSCDCVFGYTGNECGIPEAVHRSLSKKKKLTVRNIPRRIIVVLDCRNRDEPIELRIRTLYYTVDMFVLLHFEALGNRLMIDKSLTDKISVIRNFQKNSPKIQPEYLLKLSGIRSDDLIVHSRPIFIPKPEILTFLKLYDGFDSKIKLRSSDNIDQSFISTVETYYDSDLHFYGCDIIRSAGWICASKNSKFWSFMTSFTSQITLLSQCAEDNNITDISELKNEESTNKMVAEKLK